MTTFEIQESDLSIHLAAQVNAQSIVMNEEQSVSINLLCHLAALWQQREKQKPVAAKSGRRRKAGGSTNNREETPSQTMDENQEEAQAVSLPTMLSFGELCALIETNAEKDELFLNSFKAKLEQTASGLYGTSPYLPLKLLTRKEINDGKGIALSPVEISEVRFQHAFGQLTQLWKKMLDKTAHNISYDTGYQANSERESALANQLKRAQDMLNMMKNTGTDLLNKITTPSLNISSVHQLSIQDLMGAVKNGKISLDFIRTNHDTGEEFEDAYELDIHELMLSLDNQEYLTLKDKGDIANGESGDMQLFFELVPDETNPIHYEKGNLRMAVDLHLSEYLDGKKTIITPHKKDNGDFVQIVFNLPDNQEIIRIGSVFKVKGMGFTPNHDLMVEIRDILLPPRNS